MPRMQSLTDEVKEVANKSGCLSVSDEAALSIIKMAEKFYSSNENLKNFEARREIVKVS